MAVTQEQIDEMQRLLDAGDRGAAYIYYYELIKSFDSSAARQILIQAQITTYSGFFGGAVLIGNAIAKHANPALYPATLDGFSRDIVQGLINAIQADADHILTRDQIQRADSGVWADKGLRDYFPGKARYSGTG